MRLAWIGFALILCACGSGDKEHLRLAASAYLRADEADNKNIDSDLEFDMAMADFEKAVDVISDERQRYEIGGCGSTLKHTGLPQSRRQRVWNVYAAAMGRSDRQEGTAAGQTRCLSVSKPFTGRHAGSAADH